MRLRSTSAFERVRSWCSAALIAWTPAMCLADPGGSTAAGEPSSAVDDDATPVLIEAAVGPAWFKGDPGVWVEAMVAAAMQVGRSTQLALGGSFVLTQASETDEQDFNGDGIEDREVEDSLGFGVSVRGYLDQRLAGWLVGRIGISLGLAHVAMESPYCGDVTATAMSYGLWGGPVVLLGDRVELGVTADLVQYPRNACSAVTDLESGITRPNAFRQAFLDPGDFDGTVTLLGRVGYRF